MIRLPGGPKFLMKLTNATGKGRHYYRPERIGRFAKRDAALGRDKFWVYVLETDRGHYVGHTARIRSRIHEHRAGKSKSTAGACPRLVWKSAPMQSRSDAASFEAALKSYRERRHPRFREITGEIPRPFHYHAYRFRWRPFRGGGGNGLPIVVFLVLIALVLLWVAWYA